MKKTALVLLGFCACHRHQDAARDAPPPQQTATAADTSVVASPAPSESVAAAPSASATQFGMIGLLNAQDDAGIPWGREDSLGEGIGLGNIGTIGHHGPEIGGNHTNAPHVRQGTTTVNGRLPPEVIQRIVRQNFGRFRLCYERGLQKDPTLSGKVAVKFVIDTQGAVSSSTRDSTTTMTDANVVSCITRAFSSLSFPQPEGGIVVVIYPLIFEPSDAP